MVTNRIILLDPTAQSKRKEIVMAIRPENLEGKVLGVVWNTKPGGDILLGKFAEELNERFKLAQILSHKKRSPSLGIDEESLNQLSVKCDLVIVGIGD